MIEQGDPIARRVFGAMAATEAWERLRAGGPEVSPWHDLVELTDPERDLDAAAAIGTRFVIPGDEEWPGHLDAVANLGNLGSFGGLGRHVGPPYGLWVRGDANLRQVLTRSIAVVGSRQCSNYGAEVTGALASGLVDHEITMVSGGHYGVDTAAHQAALSAGGMTVAIRAAGIGVRDLESDMRLLARIADEGILVSEKPPGCPPNSLRHFARNRLIAASTLASIVTEASLDCEALNVAEWAAASRRPVLAVPGSISAPTSAGTHWLIRGHQAQLVTDVGEVLDALPPSHKASTTLVHQTQTQRHVENLVERRAESGMEDANRLDQSRSSGVRAEHRSHLTVRGQAQAIDGDVVDGLDGPGIEL